VKFAKYIPSLEQTDEAMQQAWSIIDESLEYHHAPADVPQTSDSTDTAAENQKSGSDKDSTTSEQNA
jgi:hypothetical protein